MTVNSVPRGWHLCRFKWVARLMYGESLPNEARDDGEVPVVGSNGVVGTHSKANTLSPVIVVGRKGSFGKLNYFESPAFAIDTTYFIDRRSTDTDVRWLYYAMQPLGLDAYTEDSAIPGLAREFVHDCTLAVAPLVQQRAIAAFLEGETARIDTLIAKKEGLLALLEEKRTALITRAVTKGLDPAVPMKESGVEWLGRIPALWELQRNKVLFREVKDVSADGTEELLTVSHITGVTPRAEKEVFMFMAESTEGYKRCRKDDVVVNTMWAYMGALGVAPQHGIVSPSYNVYQLRGDALESSYFDLLCRTPAYVSQINQNSEGVWRSRLRLYPEAFLELLTPVPPREEQRRIVAHVQQAEGRERPLREALVSSIALLREYRTALISAAVTGRIDVSGRDDGGGRAVMARD